jgi:hypothetical protein
VVVAEVIDEKEEDVVDYWLGRPASWLIQPKTVKARYHTLELKPALYDAISAQGDRDALCSVLQDLSGDPDVTYGNFGARLLERIRERGETTSDAEERARLHHLDTLLSANLGELDDLWRRWQHVLKSSTLGPRVAAPTPGDEDWAEEATQ